MSVTTCVRDIYKVCGEKDPRIDNRMLQTHPSGGSTIFPP